MSKTTLTQIATNFAQMPSVPSVPKYRRVIDAMVEAIEGGLLSPGDRIPPENEVAKLFSVSLGTVQTALRHLANSGLVQRSPRRGTFVAGRQANEVYVFRFRDPETGQTIIPFTRVLSVSEGTSDGRWRQFLNSDRCVQIERLTWVEGDPPAFSQFFIPFDYGRHLLNESIEHLHGKSFHRFLAENSNLPTLRTKHYLHCRQLCAAACRHLLVPKGTFGTVWDVVGYSYQQVTTYQSIQLPAGHRPIELDVARGISVRSSQMMAK